MSEAVSRSKSDPTARNDCGDALICGDLLLLEGSEDCCPEWLVVGQDREGWSLILPAEDEGFAEPGDVVIGSSDPMGPLIIRCQRGIWLPPSAASGKRPSGALTAPQLERVRERLRQLEQGAHEASALSEENAADPDHIDHLRHLGALIARLVAAHDGEHAAMSPRRLDLRAASSPSPARRMRRVRTRWLLAAAAAVAVAVLSTWPRDAERLRDGVYRLRSSGELGVELEVGHRRCLPVGVEGSAPCAIRAGDRVRVLYRRDHDVPFPYFTLLLEEAGGARELLPGAWDAPPLPPTRTEGRDRCPTGFCEVDTVPAQAAMRGTAWAVFRKNRLVRDEVMRALGADELDAGADTVVYRFVLSD